MKTFKKIILSLILTIGFFSISNGQITVSTISLSKCTIGDTVIIPVNVTNLNNVGSITMRVTFDPTKVQYLGYTGWPSVLSGMISGPTNPNTVGYINFAWGDYPGRSYGSGKLFDLKFKHISGTSPLVFPIGGANEIKDEDDNPYTVTYTNGAIIQGAVGVATITTSGSTAICQGDSVRLNSLTNPGFTYQWVKDNVDISGATKDSLWVKTIGAYKLKVFAFCGDSTSSVTSVTMNYYPDPAGTITGSSSTCKGSSNVAYSIPSVNLATAYTWSLPSGASIVGGANTNSILVDFANNASTGVITVVGTNACGNGPVSSSFNVAVDTLPYAAGNISGSSGVCQGASGIVYSVPLITGATDYIWTLPFGATITSGANTNSITVDFASNAISGDFTVKGTNHCGNGIVSANFPVAVKSTPNVTITTTGNTNLCIGDSVIFEVANDVDYSYAWYDGSNPIIGATTYKYYTKTAGAFTVQITNTIGGCSNISIVKNVMVNALPSVSSNIISTTMCSNDSVELSYNLTGQAPWTITLNGDILNQVISNISVSPWKSWVKPTINKDYTIINVSDGNVCSNLVNAQTSIIVKNTSSSSVNITSCNTYLWPINGTTYTTSGTYSHKLINSVGCDSIITLNLTVNYSNTGSENITACNTYTWPANGTTYTTSGTYTANKTNILGCDSIVSLYLTINYSNSGSESVTRCDSYTWSANNTTYTTSGTYTSNLLNKFGCDSLATLYLTIHNSNSGSESISSCDTYIWNGNTYSTSGIYKDTLQNIFGCDSISTLNLTIYPSPIANAGNDVTITIGQPGVQIGSAAIGGNIYSWTPGIGLSDSTIAMPFATPADTTTYILHVVKGMCSSSDTINVNVQSTFPIGGTVTYDNLSSTPLPGLKLYLHNSTNTIIDSCLTNSSGQYNFVPQVNGNYTISIISTLNWGGVTSADKVIILKNTVGVLNPPLSGLRLFSADVNGNGFATSADGTVILRRVVGVINSFVAGDWKFNPDTVRVAGLPVVLNFNGICIGDVNVSNILGSKATNTVQLNKVGSIIANVGDIVNIPIRVSHTMNTGSVSFFIDYPENSLEVLSVNSILSNTSELITKIDNGIISIAWADMQTFNFQNNDVVFTIKARILSVNKPIEFNLVNNNEFTDGVPEVYPYVDLYYPNIVEATEISKIDENHIQLNLFPNPFSNQTVLNYTLPSDGQVIVNIYDETGKLVYNTMNESKLEGANTLKIEGANLADGLYYIQIQLNTNSKIYTGSKTILKKSK